MISQNYCAREKDAVANMPIALHSFAGAWATKLDLCWPRSIMFGLRCLSLIFKYLEHIFI